MRSPLSIPALAILAVVLLCASSTGQHHDSTYIVRYPAAAFLLTGSGQATTLYSQQDVGRPVGMPTMDFDNRHLLSMQFFNGQNSLNWNRPGLMRVNPATRTGSMFFSVTDLAFDEGADLNDPVIDHNGDYLVTANRRYSNALNRTVVLKVDRQGNATTLLSKAHANTRYWTDGTMGIDIKTGHLLLRWGDNPRRMVLMDVETGQITGVWSSYQADYFGIDELPQNHATGALQYYYGFYISGFRIKQLLPGQTTPPSAVGTVPTPFDTSNGMWDLQTAPMPRQIYGRWNGRSFIVYSLDTTNWAVTSLTTAPFTSSTARIDFYRGRHTQTVRTAPGQWDVRFSAPKFPNKPYAAAISLAGTSPAIPLPDGRRINMSPDGFTALSGFDVLRPFWQPGPGVLDAQGEATAKIDLSSLGTPLGAPLWISWLVVDPQAPGGIAYIPDVYVMRV